MKYRGNIAICQLHVTRFAVFVTRTMIAHFVEDEEQLCQGFTQRSNEVLGAFKTDALLTCHILDG